MRRKAGRGGVGRAAVGALTAGVCLGVSAWEGRAAVIEHSIARSWSDQTLLAIRNDAFVPTVHGRDLFHVSAAMYDAWAAFDEIAAGVFHNEKLMVADVQAAREEAISFAAYRVIRYRFVDGPGASGPGRFATTFNINEHMVALGYDPGFDSTEGDSPAALGNRIAQAILNQTFNDGSNEANAYADTSGYTPVNPPLVFDEPGTLMNDPNRWAPLQFTSERRDKFGRIIEDKVQDFVTPHWGGVTPFAMTAADLSPNGVYFDQGPQPHLGGAGDADFRAQVHELIRFASKLDPTQGEMIDVSPASRGNSSLTGYEHAGYDINPHTGLPYEPNVVNSGDWHRLVADFWSLGPPTSAPPGLWNNIGDDVTESMEALGIPKRIGGTGPEVDDLEWDVKMYLALNGAVNDAGIAAWDHKAYYDSVRPISMIRSMGQLGQSSDPGLMVEVGGEMVSTYHPDGLMLEEGLVEVITPETTAAGGKHEHLAGHEGKIALYSWQGDPPPPSDSPAVIGGVGWILAEEWMPYQPDFFVTPAFPGYVSGHSTFHRAPAEVMAALTGDIYFPGGIYEWFFPAGSYSETEYNPSAEMVLQWATYFDASDEAGLSRLLGGVHPAADDISGRMIGHLVGLSAWEQAMLYFTGTIPEPSSAMLLLIAGAGLMGRRR